ncbi:VPDSG-CTERM sorting domain-containing protein [Pelagicoccus sp. SDUM812003]|uniref:VPDSG-CTERM sorting domain-containing protein n=1 Tax=Pelagicoccus sp. SDUM812003 TaxID=3041267 RepID=UPI00280F7A6F|nr:VPDSG-CTERM sorting domain-containing protein [Pelagicoccus sp. SDUM812003]MDQ8203747.1 VPDSG-CTERM sorting domain-containing protein [Pelagicoccus sp. SDUM812003]
MKTHLKLVLAALSSLVAAATCLAIPASYGTATHSTTEWQELATYDNNGLVDEQGVFWSVDNGVTWGREALSVGQTVKFQFNMHKRNVGTHYADFVKAWIDWNKNGSFDDPSETIIFAKQELPNVNGSYTPPAPGEADFVFESGDFTIESFHIGSLWLRARVVCSESLNDKRANSVWEDQWDLSDETYNNLFQPTGHLWQGEVEEHKISVVPDASSTIALLGGALFGLAFFRRQARR